MAEFKLGRIRFVWKNNWAAATVYYKDDVVRFGGRTYICTVGHTSESDFYTDLDSVPTKWNQMSDGQEWKGDWATDTLYKERDLVKYGGNVYICTDGHTSAASESLGLEDNSSDWQLYAEGLDWRGNWSTSTRYKVNDLVRYGGYTYNCNTAHTSNSLDTSGLEADQAKWDIFNPGLEYKGAWATSTLYKVNDIIKYGANLYVSSALHTSSSTFSDDSANWSIFVEGVQFENEWNGSTVYQPGDIVKYGGNLYVSKLIHSAANPSTETTYWSLFSSGFDFASDWSSGTAYKIGQVVNLNGYTYIAIADSTNQIPPNATYWTRLNSGVYWRGEWQNSTDYYPGDAVRWGSNSYICVSSHTSNDDDSTTTPDAARSPEGDISGVYWNALIVSNEADILNTKGDLIYYSGSGPSRLPIGTEGQVLRAGTEYPEWVTLGSTDYVYYVATHGQDHPAPVHGKTLDKPWKTIRYACEQVENGPRNPNAKKLLELNRAFIQREVVEWVDYQITNNLSPFTPSFDYDEYKCERDVGYIVDALIHDLGHGGNVKMRGAANSYVGGLSESETEPYGVGLGNEDSESVAALNYMLTVATAVLNQSAPTINYQVLNGDNSTAVVSQHFDPTIESESGVTSTITDLVEIVTDAITAGNANDIPARYAPANLIRVATGIYKEVLPIIVPEHTCVLGEELRSTKAGPAAASDRTLDASDAKYSLGALTRMETIVSEIVQGSDVTESSGNTEIQSRQWPYADATIAADAQKLVRTIQQNIDFRLNSNILASYTLPTGYNSSYLSGYGDARTLIKENRDFVKAEVVAYISATYPTIKYSRTKCKRDVGYIIDALIYDLTYGGNSQSVNAALAYFDGPGSTFAGVFGDASEEVTATIGSYERMKTVLQQIAANTTVTKTTGNTATQWTDSVNLTGGSSASAFIGANIDLVINILTAGSTTGAPSITVTTITGGNTAATGSAHGLTVGDTFTPRSTANGFVSGTKYWILTTPSGTEFTVSTTFGGSTHTLTNGTGLSIVGDVVDLPPATNGVTSTTTLITAAQTLDAAQETIVTNTTAFIAANYPSLTYNSAKCERDVRLILEAVMFDFMFNSNVQTLRAGYAYLRSTASDVYELGQKAATRAAFAYAKDQAKSNVGGDSTAQARIESLMILLDDIVFSGSTEGSRCATDQRTADYAVLQLERNRDYIIAEIDAWIDSTYTDTVTAVTASTDILTISDTSWIQRNAAVRFSGTLFGGLSSTTTYYIQNVVSSTEFKIATTRNSNTALDIASDDTGSMTVSLYYNSELCLRDVGTYIDALKYDLKYPGNYKSLYAARYYANAAVGSLEEDMFYLRDATGLRDMTLDGLTGDLLAPNEFGTSRVSAGAYASLDPGWGPEDYRTWIITRSPYIQGITTFGTAAIGQKIDGALHNGGNDSMVSNDFTQVISDGIGAWVANNGRAELVSVFTYYSHIGYLSTGGGRIRGTNGNNSYGDFGSVAEGFDSTETPNTAIVDNKFQYTATIGSVVTNGSALLRFEFDHAGNDYSEVTYTITGGGAGASIEADEFRDDGVYQVRLLDFGDDSSGQFGGDGYITNSNTAQAGSSTSITLAATDPITVSSAYIGMKVVITGGSGVGQFGIISSYNAGTKVANVVKESTGASGWDHMVPGTTLVATDASSTYTVEPAISFTSPGFDTTAGTLASSGSWRDIKFGTTVSVLTGLSGTYSGSGSGATFNVIRNGFKYNVTINNGGLGYTRLETITIPGNSLGGLAVDNDLTLVITSVNSVTGAILAFDQSGFGCSGTFVAVKTGSSAGAYSTNGDTWTAMSMPSSADWISVTHGMIDDGSSIAKQSLFVAVANNSDKAAYSEDGIIWTASTLPASANWIEVVYGNGRFVAIADDSTTVAISLDGIVWDLTGSLATTGATTLTYGMGVFVVLFGGTTDAQSSTDGVTWTSRTLPAATDWVSVTWGNGAFVAVASNSNAGAISINGTTWSAITLGSPDGSSTAGFQKVRYGQGLFMATTYLAGEAGEGYSYVMTSENGISWESRGLPESVSPGVGGYRALAFGNPHQEGNWVVAQYTSGNYVVNIKTGVTTKARAFVAENKIFAIRITEPGSGYINPPTMTITDPNNTYEAPFAVRKGRGVLANPSYINRGSQYTTGSAEVNTGDGYADFYQNGGFVAVRRITERPVAGSNVVFGHLPDRTFKLVNVLTFRGTEDGSYTAFFQLSPTLAISEAPDDGVSVTTRIRYSQVRLTGHDFLDIGTGSFAETNYPGTPTQDPIPSNETVENNGGRVFFTSTDQDGNFRVGDLFAIEQATGIATLNADAFNISGLQELNLGNVTLGGGSATVTEFSTDPFFTADSDNIVPTQRAIKAYIAGQIGGGGASLNVNSVTAGVIFINTNQITTTDASAIRMNATFEFRGGVIGLPIAFNYFLT